MKVNCIIIDDEPLAATVIKTHLATLNNFNLLGEFTSAIDALHVIESGDVDVMFLDINLPIMNGLDFLKSLSVKPLVIITTAYREFAVESFDLDVLDYLVKPIPFGRFLKAVNKVTNRLQEQHLAVSEFSTIEPHVFLKVDKKLMKVHLDDIFFIESLKDYIKVFTAVGDYLVHKSMTGISEELPSEMFLRVHRSYLIALHKITSVEGNSVEVGGRRIPIGRNYSQEAKERIFSNNSLKN